MDQDAYHKTYNQMNERYCLYEKGILAGECSCSQSERFYLAERVGVHCKSDDAQQGCREFLELLRHHARFALKTSDELSALPHGKAMRLQSGGLRGLYTTLNDSDEFPPCIEDVHALISLAIEIFDSLDKIPFQDVIKQVAAYEGRKRRSKR